MNDRRSLSALVASSAGHEAIAAHLDGLTPYQRNQDVLALSGKEVGKLYEAVKGAPRLTQEEIVPKGERGTVIFEGRNSLPAFSSFQKRFARVGDAIVGYNHQTMSPLTGPGFFVVRDATPGEVVSDELWFDYTVPPPRVPPGFPAFKPNDSGFSRLVYGNMKDFCRRVASGVLVGKAFKKGKPEGSFFALTRAV